MRRREKGGLIGTVFSVNGIPIRLTEERWSHIVEHHPEIEQFLDEILSTVSNPKNMYLLTKKQILAATNTYDKLETFGLAKNIAVHYREFAHDGFILTAFVISDKKLERRFRNWKRLK
ncbi:MAG: hypothetical protein ACRD32_03560 [Nitrososphaerales archaeon]